MAEMRGGFLRTAETESRVKKLEEQMARVMDHLGLNNAEPPPKDLRDPDTEWERAAPQRPIPQPKVAKRR